MKYPNSNHYKNGKFYNPEFLAPMNKFGTFKNLLLMIFNSSLFRPNKPLPELKPNWKKFLNRQEIQLIWFGHSTFIIRSENKTFLFDPVFTDSVAPFFGKRFQPSLIKLGDLPPIDFIVLTHNHYDHFDKKVIQFYADKTTQFIVPLGIEILLKQCGIKAEKIYALDWWNSFSVNNIELTALPAHHNSGRGLFDKNKTLWCGWAFITPKEKIYYSGDSAYGKHFKEIGDFFNGFDLALIENGQYNEHWKSNHMFPEQTIAAFEDVKAEIFMPVHWGAYALARHKWNESVNESFAFLMKKKVKTLTPKMGEVFNLKASTGCWWNE